MKKTEYIKHIDETVHDLLQCAIVTSVNIKFITNYIVSLKNNKVSKETDINISYLTHILSLRRNAAYMNFLSIQIIPIKNEEFNKVHNEALEKYEAAVAKEEELNKLDIKNLTPEVFIKYLKED